MALDLSYLQERVREGCFFTADTPLIEYLSGRNLSPLEYYGLLVAGEEIYFFRSDKTELEGMTAVSYGLEDGIRDKESEIMALLSQMPIPQPVWMDLRLDSAIYLHYFQGSGKRVENLAEDIKRQRMRKSEAQLERIESCLLLNQAAYEDFRTGFRQGMNELEGKRIIEESYYKNAGEEIPYIRDLCSGARTCGVSGNATDYVPGPGDAILLDLLPRRGGIYCDNTRTFFMGEPGKRKREIYRVLLEAMRAAEEFLKPGATAQELYRRMAGCFERYGFGQNFLHHAGHGFGHTIYEAPYFVPGDLTRLEPDMTVALEPGLYLPGEFGIRIENNYRITKTGFRVIGGIPLEIEHYIIG